MRLFSTAIAALLALLILTGTAGAETVPAESPQGAAGQEQATSSSEAPAESTGSAAGGGVETPTPQAPESPPPSEGPTEQSTGGEVTAPSVPEPSPTPEPVSQEAEVHAPAPEAPSGAKAPEAPGHIAGDEHPRTSEITALLAAASPTGPSSGEPDLAAAAGAASPPPGTTPMGSEVVELGRGPATPAMPSVVPLARARTLVEQRAEQRRCVLYALGAPGAGGCEGGWMVSTRTPSPVTAAAAAAVAGALGARPGVGRADNDPAGSAGGERPATPSPGPAPGGAGGGVSAGGSGGGVGLSGFLALTGLLLLAAPRALRRMALSCRPYRTAFFVLIPERPG
jgi:hypothetical protein